MDTVLISGSSGLLGTALREVLEKSGVIVTSLQRDPALSNGQAVWNSRTQQITFAKDFSTDAVIHLAGEPIAAGRWSKARKQRIYESRVLGTRALVQALSKLSARPKVLLSASAVGIYGSRAAEILTEQSASGVGFLAELGTDWETEALRAEDLGIRVVLLRLGIILSLKGGALAKMLPAFRYGLGGKLGSGDQWMSWIDIQDAVDAAIFLLRSPQARGAYNIVAPAPLTNIEFTHALGSALHRPTFFSIPKLVLSAIFGELANAALLASQRCQPSRLLEAGFNFSYPEIGVCLNNLLRPNVHLKACDTGHSGAVQ